MRWVDEIGLLLDILGALILVSGLFIDEERALELGVGRWASDKKDENLKLPQVADRLSQSRRAKIGAVFLVLGFIGQAIGNWPS